MKAKLPATLLNDLSVGGLIIALTITSLNAEVITTHVFTNPLGSNFKSTDNGGTLPAIDAYKDGIGVIVLDNLGQNIQIDNSAMNTLVYKYGETAKKNNTTIIDEVTNRSGTAEDKLLISDLNINTPTSVPFGMIIEGTAANGLQYTDCKVATYYIAKINCENSGMRLPGSGELLSTYPRDFGTTYISESSNGVPLCKIPDTNFTENAYTLYNETFFENGTEMAILGKYDFTSYHLAAAEWTYRCVK